MNGKLIRRCALGMAVLLLAALPAACTGEPAASEPKQWHPVFLSRFQPSEELIQKLDTCVQDVNAVSDCDGVVLSVPQTLGDDHSLYIILEITFPESINLRNYLDEDENGDASSVVSIGKVSYYRGETSYEEIKGMDSHELKSYFLKRNAPSPSQGSSRQTLSVDLDRNSCSYLLQFTTSRGELNGDYLSVVVEELGFDLNGKDALLLAEGPLAISWQMENSGPAKEFTILNQDGEPAGSGRISSFVLDLYLNSNKFHGYRDFIKAVQLIQMDGTSAPPRGNNSSGFGDSVSGEWTFRYLIDLDQIKAIQIGEDYLISLTQ